MTLWRRSNNETRRMFLQPYSTAAPSDGYAALATLMQAGYFDIVITYNFDRLLELALNNAGLHERTDYQVITRGESEPAVMAAMMEAPEPRIKILKLHGSLLAADFFLFSDEEMLNYPPDISKLLLRVDRPRHHHLRLRLQRHVRGQGVQRRRERRSHLQRGSGRSRRPSAAT